MVNNHRFFLSSRSSVFKFKILDMRYNFTMLSEDAISRGLRQLLHLIIRVLTAILVSFYGDLVYKLKKIVGSNNFSAQFIKIISHYKKIGYNINVLQQTACLVVNPITVGNFAFLFNCTPVGRTSDSMMVPT